MAPVTNEMPAIDFLCHHPRVEFNGDLQWKGATLPAIALPVHCAATCQRACVPSGRRPERVNLFSSVTSELVTTRSMGEM
ncbi:hypothetical protein [Parafrankia irregularis]|uniref:hypothetical protein n=1 Tax=Parafrankia irregularis TaxID=795642 RepID=UPI0013F4C32E|nr:hypothetical protein [Parafrankia irregularis]MBE3206061.1 hypothetical protein [Parafrankia sp. CH37]